MFERFTDTARDVVVRAQEAARRLGHGYIGCEHLLLAVASTGDPASVLLRDHGVTPERVEAEILRIAGRGPVADPLAGLDREALASIGIDLDVVRTKVEAMFGPDALARALPDACKRNRPAWGKGPVAHLMRRRRRRHAHRNGPPSAGAASRGNLPNVPGPVRGHLRFTPRAKKSLERSLRQALALKDDHIGVHHLALGLLTMDDGMVPAIMSGLGTSNPALRAAILDRYRKAS